MKLPQKPPPLSVLLNELDDTRQFLPAVELASKYRAGCEYMHWDELRHRPPPAGLSHQRWWLAIKLARLPQFRGTLLADVTGASFKYLLTDQMLERLHQIDRMTGGQVALPEAITNPDTKDRYLVTSLIEEAITSSVLEGAATTRRVARDMIRTGRPPRDQSERMIANNFRAMQHIGSVKNELLTKDLVLEVHRLVTDQALDDPCGSGRFRREDEPVVVSHPFEDVVLHKPPPASELEERMSKMCDFANEVASEVFIHPVIRSIILHFWLAYDHPFVDGNGRTARALFYWSMLRHGFWLCEFISISEIILRAPARYGRAFLYTETDENDLTYFLLYHLDIILRAIDQLYAYVERKSREIRRLERDLRAVGGLNHRQRAIISHGLRHTNHRYTVESHKRSHKVVHQTARNDLLDLVERGLLEARKVGRQWEFTPVRGLEEKLRGEE